jgi:hypothetical protein
LLLFGFGRGVFGCTRILIVLLFSHIYSFLAKPIKTSPKIGEATDLFIYYLYTPPYFLGAVNSRDILYYIFLNLSTILFPHKLGHYAY